MGIEIFSSNPDKAWGEKFFLFYSLIWPVLFGLYGVTGLYKHFGDIGNNMVTSAIGAPLVIVPYLFCPYNNSNSNSNSNNNNKSNKSNNNNNNNNGNEPIYNRYWFKFLLWIWIFAFVATYFFTEYFFEVLEMTYNFPMLKINFDSILVGKGKQRVPLM